MSVETVLSSRVGSVVAPAGCGKTNLIIEVLRVSQPKPYLVLTHTTAGVTALKNRLVKSGISNNNYVIATIDGWTLRIAQSFSGHCPVTAVAENPRMYYPALRQAVLALLDGGHIDRLLKASYCRVLVDEYQDCDVIQHTLVQRLSNIIPATVFGDHLQSIFNFGSNTLPPWCNVQTVFPEIVALTTPWRWINANAEPLGYWLLDARQSLLRDQPIDLCSCNGYINCYHRIDNEQTHSTNVRNALSAIRGNMKSSDRMLVIGDSMRAKSRHGFAKQCFGIDVVEPVDLGEISHTFRQLDKTKNGNEVFSVICTQLSLLMTGVGKTKFHQRVQTICHGKNRKVPSPAEHYAAQLVINNDIKAAVSLITALAEQTDTRVYRYCAYNALVDGMRLKLRSDNSWYSCFEEIRERRRWKGDSRISKQTIGSTLLLKGLEAEHSLILDASEMNANHLYVALTRGAQSVTVFSSKRYAGI
jgi:hypothetical protein